MQTTLLGLAITLIIALVAALVGPLFIDWNQFRPQFETEASRILGTPVRVGGELDARLLPAPSLRLRSVTVGGANDLGKVHAARLDVEFSLGELMRGQWRATELTIDGLAVDLGLDPQGRIDLPAASGASNLAALAIDRLNLTGRIALHDAASRGTLELSDIIFSGDVRSLAGAVRGDGNFSVSGIRYPFRVSSGQSTDGNGTRVHLAIEPGDRPFSADLDGILAFEQRAPRFDGSLVLARPVPKAKAGEASPAPWKLSAKVKADAAQARFEQVEASYGAEENALRATGVADIRFGAAPALRASLSARQLDADRLTENAGPLRLVPGLRDVLESVPHPPFAARLDFSAEQIMLGGRPLQNLEAGLHGDATAWTVDRLDFRAPGATHVVLGGGGALAGSAAGLRGTLDIDSADFDTLMGWLQGRSDIALRGQKPLRLHGNVALSSDRFGIEGLKAEIDGGTLEGRLALTMPAKGGSRLDAALRAERLDLDSAGGFVRALGGPQGAWPEQAQISLDVDRAMSAGQELRGFAAKLSYDPKTMSLDQLRFGGSNGVATEGSGRFDRTNATGKLALSARAASLAQITALVAPLAPSLASRIDAVATGAGEARAKLTLDLDKGTAEHADARAALELDSPDLKGRATIAAKPDVAAIRGIDLDGLRRSDLDITARLSSPRGQALTALLGLDRAVAVGEGASQFDAALHGAWHAPLRLEGKITGSGLDAEVQGAADPWGTELKANLNAKVRSVNLAPLFGLKPSDTLAQNISLSSRVTLAGNRLSFDDLDSTASHSRLRGHLALTLDTEKSVDGEIGLDALELAPALALAIGAANRDAAEPLGAGLLKGWRGRVGFQALRGTLPDGVELRPLGGTVKSDGQSLTLDSLKGNIGGGTASATIDARPSGNGIALNARVELSGVDGAALGYRGLKMPAGRASLQMTLASQGRSASALAGGLSGSGTVTLEQAAVTGLDPRAFEVAIRASDAGQAADDAKLRQLVEPVLASGALLVASAQIPFTVRDGRLRVGATALDAQTAHAIVSGGYDIPADQVDIRASLTSPVTGPSNSRPEIQIFTTGTPDALSRTVDVTALSSWLAVRAIDRETRRLDAIERGEAPSPTPASVPPPATAALPELSAPAGAGSDQPPSEVPLPGRDPRRLQPKVRLVPHPPVPPLAPGTPVVGQQAAPLPPLIELRPAPAPPPPRPKPRPPMVITPLPPN